MDGEDGPRGLNLICYLASALLITPPIRQSSSNGRDTQGNRTGSASRKYRRRAQAVVHGVRHERHCRASIAGRARWLETRAQAGALRDE